MYNFDFDISSFITGRKKSLFNNDIKNNESFIKKIISNSSFLVIGAAGSIGKAVTIRIYENKPKKLDLIDIAENNLYEVIRDLRNLSIINKITNLNSYLIDVTKNEFFNFLGNKVNNYDFILNFSAIKHVRSEKDIYSIYRMFDVNANSVLKTLEIINGSKCKNYFSVSTDKACNPVNLMGASKNLMEKIMFSKKYKKINITSARFANVLFSEGSLTNSYRIRFSKKQPLPVPIDIKRYFISLEEASDLCLLGIFLIKNGEIAIPKIGKRLKLTGFMEVASKFLKINKYEIQKVKKNFSQKNINILIALNKWPSFYLKAETTGEKKFEEFYNENENIEKKNFKTIYTIIVKRIDDSLLYLIKNKINLKEISNKDFYLKFCKKIINEFKHNETKRNLDQIK